METGTFLDVRTLMLTICLGQVTLGMLMLLHRGREAGDAALRVWMGAQVIRGIGVGLLLARETLPLAVSVHGGKALDTRCCFAAGRNERRLYKAELFCR